jgi:hypothetical protein
MHRIFLPLSAMSGLFLAVAFLLGYIIDDPRVAEAAVQQGVQWHFLMALSALCFTTLVHAIVLTYFMGTGRWIEETAAAYHLDPQFHRGNQQIKYRVIPQMVLAFLMLLATGGFGAAADPASPVQFAGWFGLSAATLHLGVSMIAMMANFVTFYAEYNALLNNSAIIDSVLNEVRRIRTEKGLAV